MVRPRSRPASMTRRTVANSRRASSGSGRVGSFLKNPLSRSITRIALRGGMASEQAPAAGGVRRGHEDPDLALGPHGEGVDGVRDARAQHGRNALALEEALHDDRLGLGAAVRAIRWARERDWPLVAA